MASEEVMVAQNQGIGQKVTEIAILLQTQKEATITAINLAIPAAINLAEFIKHRVKGLHQISSFERVQDSMKTRLKIKLSFTPLDTSNKGYQAPIPESEVTEKSLDDLKKPPPRVFRDNGDEARPEFGERRRGGGFRRGRRPPRWGNTEGNREESDGYRARRFRRGRRGDPSRRGTGEVGERNEEYQRRPRGDRGPRRYRARDNQESDYGRVSRGRRPRGRRGFDSNVPDWSNKS